MAAFHLLWAIIISDIISQCAMYVLLLDNRVVMFIDKLFVSKFVFYVVLFELVVNKFHVMSFARIIGSYRTGHLMLLQNNPQGLCYWKNRVTCKMRVSACGLRGSAEV